MSPLLRPVPIIRWPPYAICPAASNKRMDLSPSPRRRADLLCNRIHDRIKGWAWTHGFCRLRVVGMIIPAHIDRFSLGAEQLGHNFGFIVCKLFGDFGKTRLQIFILSSARPRLAPSTARDKNGSRDYRSHPPCGPATCCPPGTSRWLDRAYPPESSRRDCWMLCSDALRRAPAPGIHRANPSVRYPSC